MPTFESIHFSREVASRLVAINTDNNHNKKGDTDTVNNITPVETPQALLSRNPQSLRLLKNNNNEKEDGTTSTSISTDPLHCNGFPELRHEVATKLVALSLSGKRHAFMESVLLQEQEQEQEQERSAVVLHKIPGCVSVVELLKYQKAMASSTSAGTICSITTGSSTLDHLLAIPSELATSLSSSMNPRLCSIPTSMQGGLPWGTVIQCSGATATGKTQLALQVAVSAASQNLGRVLYISSAVGQGSLKPLVLRLREVACSVATSRTQVGSMMDRVSFQTVQDGYQLLTCLAELEESCLLDESQFEPAHDNESQQSATTTTTTTTTSIRVVVLDAASGCLTTEDEVLLQRVALRLKQLARHYNLLVWINNSSTTPRPKNIHHQRHSIDGTAAASMRMNTNTNSTPSETSTKPKVALGSTWKRAWGVHVALKVLEKEPAPLLEEPQQQQPKKLTVQATLEGHPFKRCNDSLTAEFCITATGIQDSQPVVEEEEEDEMA